MDPCLSSPATKIQKNKEFLYFISDHQKLNNTGYTLIIKSVNLNPFHSCPSTPGFCSSHLPLRIVQLRHEHHRWSNDLCFQYCGSPFHLLIPNNIPENRNYFFFLSLFCFPLSYLPIYFCLLENNVTPLICSNPVIKIVI